MDALADPPVIALGYRARVRRRLSRVAGDAVPSGSSARDDGPERDGPLALLGRAVPLWRDRPPLERGTRALGGSTGALAALTIAGGARAPAALVAGSWAGDRLARSLAGRTAAARRAEAREALPLLLDRLAACVLAGMGIERALHTVTPGTPGVLGDALADGLRALEVGMPRAMAYERIAARAGLDELHAVLGALARAERYGSSVADTLVALAHEVRSRARAEAEAEARTAPLRLLFPLVLCFLPAFVILTIVPVALSALRTLSGI